MGLMDEAMKVAQTQRPIDLRVKCLELALSTPVVSTTTDANDSDRVTKNIVDRAAAFEAFVLNGVHKGQTASER